MSDVFISYSRRNSEFVQKLNHALNEHQIDSWIDWDDIPKGTRWLQEIYSGIENADNFLIIVSPESLTSAICHDEIAHAIEFHKRIIPIIYREVDQQQLAGQWFEQAYEQKARQNWQYIRNINWLFFRESDVFEAAFTSLLGTISQDIDHVRTHTRLTNRSLEWDKNGRRSEFLLRGSDLLNAELWLATSETKAPKPTELQTQYILASRQISNRRQNVLVGGLTSGLLIVIVLLIIAVILAQEAQFQRDRTAEKAATATYALGLSEVRGTEVAVQRDQAERNAEEARSVALASNSQFNLINHQSSMALVLALEANRVSEPSRFAQITLYNAAYAPGTRWLLNGHTSWVWDLAVSTSGRLAASASLAGDIVLWNLISGTEVARFEHPRGEGEQLAAVDDVAFSADEAYLISAGYDGLLVLWDLETKQIVWQIDAEEPLMGVSFSADGKAVFSSGSRGRVTRWNMESQEAEWSVTGGEPEGAAVNRIVVSGDGQRLLTGSDDGRVRTLDAATGAMIRDFVGHTDRVFSVAFSPDGQRVLSGSRDGNMILWDGQTGLPIHVFHHLSNVYQVLFSSDGRLAYSSSYDTSIRVWDLETHLPVQVFDDSPTAVSSLALTPDGRMLLAGDADGNVRFIDLWRGNEAARFSGFRDRVSSVAFSPDGQFVVSASYDGSVQLWSVATDVLVQQYVGHQASVSSVAFSRDGRRLVSGDMSGTAVVWDVESGKALTHFRGHSAAIASVLFTDDGEAVLSAGGRQEVFLWDSRNGDLMHAFVGHSQPNQFQPAIVLALSPDGKRLASADAEGDIFLWNMERYVMERALQQQSESIRSLAFSADGRLLLAGADTDAQTSAVLLWDLSSRRAEPSQRYEGHSDAVRSVAFSPDSTSFLSASADTHILLWDVQTGEVLQQIDGHDEPVWSVAYHPSGGLFVSGSSDATMRIWRLDTLSELQAWIAQRRYVPALSCANRAQYQIQPLCPDEDGAQQV